MRLLLLGNVERDHRQRCTPTGQFTRFNPGQQPAGTQVGRGDGIAHLRPPALAQGALQALELVARAGLNLLPAYRLQAARLWTARLKSASLHTGRLHPQARQAGALPRGAVIVRTGQPLGGRAGGHGTGRHARCRGFVRHGAQGCNRRHHRRLSPLRPAVEPAPRGLVGGHAHASGVHQRADLELCQVVVVLQAAVFDHRHHPKHTALTAIGAQPGTQALAPAIGPGHGAAHVQRQGADPQLGVWRVALPGQQLAQVGGQVAQQHGDAAHQQLKRRVAAHHQAGAVVDQHADRAEVEPVPQLIARVLSLLARIALGGDVVQQAQQQRRTAVCADPAWRAAEPVLAAPAVAQPLLDLALGLAAGRQGRCPLRPALAGLLLVVERQIVSQVAAQHLVGQQTKGLEKSPVGGHGDKSGVLHGQGLG